MHFKAIISAGTGDADLVLSMRRMCLGYHWTPYIRQRWEDNGGVLLLIFVTSSAIDLDKFLEVTQVTKYGRQ